MASPEIRRVAVIGTGLMAPGIAMCFAAGGKEVALVGRSEESLARGRKSFESSLSALKDGGLLTADEAAAALGRTAFSTDLNAAVAGRDLVVESIVEDLAPKQALFEELDRLCPLPALITSNTSGLPMTQISARMQHPERAATTHFWLPPHLIPLVEIIKGERTSDETAQRLRAVLSEIGKRPVVVNRDVPGQLGVRLLAAIIREGMYLVQEGVASAEDVDTAVSAGLGLRFPVYGPLTHVDVAGPQLMLAIHTYLFKEMCNSPEPLPILRDMVARGDLGPRTGKGFYDWTQKSAAETVARRDAFLMARLKDLYPLRGGDAKGE